MIPSRHDNPFATCWTRPGALSFRFPNGLTAESLIVKLAAHNWQGEILGPHGSGKSTLLATLRPLLARVDRPVHVVDGYEQLSSFARWRLTHRCRCDRAGLLVTSHFPTGLPTLIELSPNETLVQELVAELSQTRLTPVTPAMVAASSAHHGSNVRELLFDLYEQHEQLSRAAQNYTRRSVVLTTSLGCLQLARFLDDFAGCSRTDSCVLTAMLQSGNTTFRGVDSHHRFQPQSGMWSTIHDSHQCHQGRPLVTSGVAASGEQPA